MKKGRSARRLAVLLSCSILLTTNVSVFAAENESVIFEEIYEETEVIDTNKASLGKGSVTTGNLTYFNENGEKTVGLAEIEGKTYYFNEKGIAQTGWQNVEGVDYYFSLTTGERYENRTEIIEGVEYVFDEFGIAQVVENDGSVPDVGQEDTGTDAPNENENGGSTDIESPDGNVEDGNVDPETPEGNEDSGNTDPEFPDENGNIGNIDPEFSDEKMEEGNADPETSDESGDEENGTGLSNGSDENDVDEIVSGEETEDTIRKQEVIEKATIGWQETEEGKKYITSEDGTYAVGMQTIEKKLYYFNESGILQIGWIDFEGKRYFAAPDGVIFQNQIVSFGSTYYYMGADGSVQTGIVEVNGKLYYFNEDGIRQTGWIEYDGKKYFAATDGVIFRNQFVSFGSTYYYMGADGSVQTGIVEVSGKLYYFNENGIRQTGWIDDNGKRYFAAPDGVIFRNQVITFGNTWYCMGTDGSVQTGIVEVNGNLYNTDETTGIVVKEKQWIEKDGKRYFSKEDGTLYRNQKIGFGSTYYYMGADGSVQKGFIETADKLYYSNEDTGVIYDKGWLEVEGERYFASADGVLYRNQVITFGNTWYCMGADGSVQTGIVEVNGKLYNTDETTGIVIKKNQWIEKDGKRYFSAADGVLYRNQVITFGNTWYCMGADGSVQYGVVEINGAIYHTDEKTGIVIKKSGWIEKGDKRYYANEEGILYRDQIITFGETWYCMGKDGSVQYGIGEAGGKLYHTDKDTGIVIRQAGWFGEGKDQFFTNEDGILYRNQIITFGNTWYCMGNDGIVQYGIVSAKGVYYFADPETGILRKQAGWIDYEGKRYYSQENGVLYNNQFVSFGETYYYCGSDAAIVTGQQVIEGVIYNFTEEGVMIKEGGWGEYKGNKYYKNPATGFPYKNQWVSFGSTYYYANSKGHMVSGWQTIGGFRYYFYPDTNIMARNTTIDGLRIGPDGKVVTAKDTLNKIYDVGGVGIWNTDYIMTSSQRSALNAAIAAFENRGWPVSFVLVDINTGQGISYNPTRPIYSASCIKGPYVMSLLNAGYAPDSEMYLAVKISDNDAYASLRYYYGSNVFANWLSRAGVSTSQAWDHYVTTTALDVAKMWLYGYQTLFGVNASYSSWARSTFQGVLNSPISARLSGANTVYSKPGWLQGIGGFFDVHTDGSVVTDGRNPYVLSIMVGAPGHYAPSTEGYLMENLASQLDAIHHEMTR